MAAESVDSGDNSGHEAITGDVRIITARRIITMTAGQPEALAVRAGWIVAAGSLESLREAYRTAEVLDFPGATITPGFNDAHQHPTICAEQSLQVDLSPGRVRNTAEVAEAGWRACVHANGDRAIRYVLDAVTAAQQARARRDPRHRIEHTSIITPEIIGRMRDQHVVAVPFANYALAPGDKLRGYYGDERAERMFAHRTMLDAGIPTAGSSDHPCGPYEPLFAMQSCVTRLDPAGRPFGLSQRITPGEALALYTAGSAYASGEETTKGKLAPGYLADFAVLGDDPLTVDPARLADVPVLETWVGGSRVWARD